MIVEPVISVVSLGIVPYRECLALQLDFCNRARKESRAFILTVQHPPVITLGKNATTDHIIDRPEDFGAEVVRTDRGGDATAHMPGQLVVYPIVPLSVFRVMPKNFISLLEDLVRSYLLELGIEAGLKQEYPGVWVKEKKLCAVGVRIENRVTRHGIAINISNDLSLFSAIVPCGIPHLGVGRVLDFVRPGNCPTVASAEKTISGHLATILASRLPPRNSS